MGAAVYGPDGCTCSAADKQKTLEQTVVDLIGRVEKLEKQVRQYQQLKQEG